MKAKRVYPVPDRWINGVPHVEHDCTDPFCVESGAFTHDDPPPKAAEPTTPQDPPTGGSSDSTEV